MSDQGLNRLSAAQLRAYRQTYHDELLQSVIPFWLRHAVDRECGGFLIALDRDGSVLDTDKGIWTQCRFTWLLAHLYNRLEPRAEWLELALHGLQFVRRFGFDSDGRMFFHVTRDGRPIRKRRYSFTETFAIMAWAEVAKATGDPQLAAEAAELLGRYRLHLREGPQPPKFLGTRPAKGFGLPMINLGVAQVVRDSIGLPVEDWIEESISEIERDFVKDDLQVVMEMVGPDGEVLDHFDGRLLNPGHAIEGASFILREAKYRGAAAVAAAAAPPPVTAGRPPPRRAGGRLVDLGTRMLRYSWHRGWDREFGGLLYFRDLYDKPIQEYWHDMKFWWPHNEAIIATLQAYQLTGESQFADWHRDVHEWSYRHFPDPEFGEWYGYLHRDGRVSTALKGNLWKGPFHLPRMLLTCVKMIDEMLEVGSPFE